MAHGAAIMVSVALDILGRPDVIARAKAELLQKRRGLPYESPIPESLQPPAT